MPASLELRDVTVLRRDDGAGERAVLSSVTLRVRAGGRLALVGPNGAGKTSLLLSLVGALPWRGVIQIGDLELEARRVHEARRRIGFVFADPAEQFFTGNCFDEVAFGPRQRKLEEGAVQERVARCLEDVGLGGFEARSPYALSLGEQRRLSLATALATEPELVLLDEPTASLDPVARRGVLRILEELEATVVFATHDLDAALALGSDVAVFGSGRLVAAGGPELLENEPLLESAGLLLPLTVAARRML